MVVMTWLTILASILALGSVGHETMAGRLDGQELILRMDGSSVTCRGTLTDIIPNEGRGSLSCSDHRTGSFSYKIEAGAGTAYGYLGGEPLVLTFG